MMVVSISRMQICGAGFDVLHHDTTARETRAKKTRGRTGKVLPQIRSDQIGLSLPSPPRHYACGMGIVHTRLTREVSDSPAGVVSELRALQEDPGDWSGCALRAHIVSGRVWKRERERESKDVR